MKKSPMLGIAIAVGIYPLLFVLGSSCGLIHPVCYAYAGTFMPLLMSFVYLYVASKIQSFGAALLLNGFLVVIAFVAGEADTAFLILIGVITAMAELIRKLYGYHTLKGIKMSFIPFAYSFYAYTAHWWTDTAGSLAAAVEEMPAGYADKMLPVIKNIPTLIIMFVLTIPVALLSVKLAEKVLYRQTKDLIKDI